MIVATTMSPFSNGITRLTTTTHGGSSEMKNSPRRLLKWWLLEVKEASHDGCCHLFYVWIFEESEKGNIAGRSAKALMVIDVVSDGLGHVESKPF